MVITVFGRDNQIREKQMEPARKKQTPSFDLTLSKKIRCSRVGTHLGAGIRADCDERERLIRGTKVTRLPIGNWKSKIASCEPGWRNWKTRQT